ncbi:hypothetical protein DFH01_08245 [Falsiroseomonas bella]|uniref:Glycosyltransferase 2-like domain-containing protein n=2 Tax=Falsiroseomonas bella TaxID=2184016 RepID=A0A317FKX6_9PROT|nr:hypothetical protein DFH01_08245 [Falsiroseomonas bella]
MYLLAIKSFYRYIPGGEIVVLDDGSLTGADRQLLAAHLPDATVTPLADIATAPCPRGGCWERLLYILDRSDNNYVIQLDSDVLASDPIPEVTDAIARNTSFTLNSGGGMGIETLEQAAARVAGYSEEHLQPAAEQKLPLLPPEAGGRLYVRGSAGFAGFARGRHARGQAEAFSVAMQALLGSRWAEWGSEQIASNYLIANSPGGAVLTWPTYACFEPNLDPALSRLLHFVGSWRFDRGVYASRARRLISELERETVS